MLWHLNWDVLYGEHQRATTPRSNKSNLAMISEGSFPSEIRIRILRSPLSTQRSSHSKLFFVPDDFENRHDIFGVFAEFKIVGPRNALVGSCSAEDNAVIFMT